MTSTYFSLLAEFQTAEIPLNSVCDKFFGLSQRKAKQLASMQALPVPVYRAGSQKSGWIVSATDLAAIIDERRDESRKLWITLNQN